MKIATQGAVSAYFLTLGMDMLAEKYGWWEHIDVYEVSDRVGWTLTVGSIVIGLILLLHGFIREDRLR